MEKKVFTLWLICFFIIANVFSIMLSVYYTSPILTGRSLVATISLIIEGTFSIFIDSPKNDTYGFLIGDPYIIDLNVSATSNVTSWMYTIEDLRHNSTAYENVSFSPNSTINVIRWSNKLVVYGDDGANTASSSVIFYVYVPNSAPVISHLDNRIYFCEGNSSSYFFNATDDDEDALTPSIFPIDPFYVRAQSRLNYTTVLFQIYSGVLSKAQANRTFGRSVSVSDGNGHVDTKNTNITVIEINNRPIIEDVRVQTVWTHGDDSSFYKSVLALDTEDGNQNSGNLAFNISFLGSFLFNITNNGVMNFTPNTSQIGVYDIRICVRDRGISNPHPNISLCGQDGGPLSACDDFSLTVTNLNRAPNFTSYYPANLNFSVLGTASLFFNFTARDPDGTIPDSYWYVDNALVATRSNASYDNFSYAFGCDVSGVHTVRAEITDGLLTNSLQWNISVNRVSCLLAPPGGGGGGGGRFICTENWACRDYQPCQNTEKSYESKIMSDEDYDSIKKACTLVRSDKRYCGFQIRECKDLNYCNNSVQLVKRPEEIRTCYYTESPSCSDGITNCHDGGCELLADCGGPCLQCPTCSDGIQNQGEQGVDCGGPCPWKCEIEKPLPSRTRVFYVLLAFSVLLLVIILIQVVRIVRYKKVIKRGEKEKEHEKRD
jgi:hypothetical protein